MVKVESIEQKENVSKKNGQTYVSYRMKFKYQKNDGLWYGGFATLDSLAIDNAIKRGIIKNYADLVGKDIEFAALYPQFINENTIKYGLIYNYIVGVR